MEKTKVLKIKVFFYLPEGNKEVILYEEKNEIIFEVKIKNEFFQKHYIFRNIDINFTLLLEEEILSISEQIINDNFNTIKLYQIL